MKANTKPVVLPTKPSALLRLAVKDARAVAKMKTRRLDMRVFHVADESGKCAVCMAGAVMDRTLRADPSATLWPDNFDDPVVAKSLNLIDDLRQGIFWDFEGPAVDKAASLIRTKFDRNRARADWKTYLKAADILEAGGL